MSQKEKTIQFVNKYSGQVIIVQDSYLEYFFKIISCYKDDWVKSDNPEVVKLLYGPK